MHLPDIAAVVLALTSIAQAAAVQPRDLLQGLQNQALQNLKEAEADDTLAKRSYSLSNTGTRRDW